MKSQFQVIYKNLTELYILKSMLYFVRHPSQSLGQELWTKHRAPISASDLVIAYRSSSSTEHIIWVF